MRDWKKTMKYKISCCPTCGISESYVSSLFASHDANLMKKMEDGLINEQDDIFSRQQKKVGFNEGVEFGIQIVKEGGK